MKTASTEHINEQIGALDSALFELECEAERLSLGAVSGHVEDIEALASVQSRISQATNDRAILERARKHAAKREMEAIEAKAAVERSRQFAIAQDHAGELLKAARRADDLVQSIRDILEEIQKTEGAAWTALRASGRAPAHGGAMWQIGLWRFVLETVQAANNPPAFRPNKTIAQVAEVSWCDVVEPEAVNV